MDKQVKELYIPAQLNNEKHFKNEKHLSDLAEPINFMTKNFNDCQKNRPEKEKLIKVLREEVSYLENEYEQLKSEDFLLLLF